MQELIYGCMGLGGSWSDEPHGSAHVVEQGDAAVQAALDAGITLFDHADIYRRGKSEAVFGEVLVAHGMRRHFEAMLNEIERRQAERGPAAGKR